MRIRVVLSWAFLCFVGFVSSWAEVDGGVRNQAGWEPLFNGKDLSGWYTFLQQHGKNSDPDKIITVENGVIHLYKHAPQGGHVWMGYIGTEKEYENYHLRLEFKWGDKFFEPRLALPKDAGLYYHIVGEDAVWPVSLQYQIQLNDVGDLLALYGVACDTWIDPTTKANDHATFLDPADGGEPTVLGGVGIGYQKRRNLYELEGWNTLEVICKGNTSMHILNGKLVNRCENIRYAKPESGDAPVPLSKGRIALEIEAAEIFYRNIEIKQLPTEAPVPVEGPDTTLKVGAAAASMTGDDSMTMAGGIGPWNPKGQEGELRATAVVYSKEPFGTFAIVGCDVLFVSRDLVDAALAEIQQATGIPPEHVLVNASHTHSAPSITRVHGYGPVQKFRDELKRAIVEAVTKAHADLEENCTFEYALGAEYSVGENSRLLLADNTIFWTGPHDDRVRPTDPFDPELPVFGFYSADKKLRSVIYNHSTHTIGTVAGMVLSPSFYGLAAQQLESETGATVCFLEGASGSTHNLYLTAPVMIDRMKTAVRTTLDAATPQRITKLAAIRRTYPIKVRNFDEQIEDEKVSSYCRKRAPAGADYTIDVFRKMREELRPHIGETRETYLQVMRIGDVAIVAVPAEYFTVLGIEIKRRSPFAHTVVTELSNDWVGYIGDRKGYERGGYQTWMGHHSFCEIGTGEAIVDEVVKMLNELAAG
ncbi:MAG TPA: DUF1080 domain-containing protein [Candidatus Hydrogenedentes bacterium]|nr:DUF1080 domain-containing protein [Candidatus Hydrogenedentota bacterium]